MAEMARWGKKTWKISASSILAINNLSFSYAQVADNNTATEEKKQTNQRGKELFPLKFTTTLVAGAGIDIRKEIEEWESLVTSVNYFVLGGKRIGPALQLRKVSVSDIKLDNLGNMLYAILGFEFKEYDQETTSVKATVPPLEITASSEGKILKATSNDALEAAETVDIKIGDYVKFATGKYANGGTVPQDVMDRAHEVSAMEQDRCILGFPNGICKWAYKKDLTLV